MAGKGQYPIPFSLDGNLMNYVSGWDKQQNKVKWLDNYKFRDELEYNSFSHGRSSCQMHFISVTDNRRYNMSLGDFSRCILAGLLVNKRIKGEFTFAKKGTNYMLTPILPDET